MRLVVLALIVHFASASHSPSILDHIGGGLGDLKFDKFICDAGQPCETNVGRQMSWFSINLKAPMRGLRGHSLTRIPEGLLLVGGEADGVCDSRFHIIDPVQNTWQTIEYTGPFSPRQGHLAVLSPDERTVFLYGGSCNGQHFSDLLSFDLDSREVTRLETSGQQPPISDGMKAVVLGKLLVVFGGCNYTPERMCFDSVHTLHLETLVWVRRSTSGDSPDGRDGHAMFADHNHHVYVFGGRTDLATTSDLFQLDTENWKWAQVQLKGVALPAVEGATVTLDLSSPDSNHALVFGGCRAEFEDATPPASPPISPRTAVASLNNSIGVPIGIPEQVPLPVNSANREIVSAPLVTFPKPTDDDPEDVVVGPVSLLEEDSHVSRTGLANPPAPARTTPRLKREEGTPDRHGPGVRIRLPRENPLCNSHLYRIDLDTLDVSLPRVTGAVPSPREFHASTMVDARVFVIGGCQQRQCVSDVYILDTQLHCLEDCNGHGVCTEGVCSCHKKFSGLACEIDLRCPSNCTNRGTCVDAHCQCAEGFGGSDCSVDLRCPANCSNHGVCIDSKCKCHSPYRGDSCDHSTDCPADCSGHGVCNFGFCYCEYGFEGKDCSVELSTLPVLPAELNPHEQNSTGPAFVFVGSSQMCGGTYLFDVQNQTLFGCENECLKFPTCSHVTWHRLRNSCRGYSLSQCADLWSSPNSQVFARDPPPAPSAEELAAKESQSSAESVSSSHIPSHVQVAKSAAIAKGPMKNAQRPVADTPSAPAVEASSSSGVFMYLGVGILIGTVFGLVLKGFSKRSHDYNDEYF